MVLVILEVLPMVPIEELLPVFNRRESWAWIAGKYLPSPAVCPRCWKELAGDRARKAFVDLRRTFCQACGQRFSPAEGTPLHGTRWEPEELIRLMILHQVGHGTGRISKTLGKSPAAVLDMLQRIELANSPRVMS
jgi:transposase-like protein